MTAVGTSLPSGVIAYLTRGEMKKIRAKALRKKAKEQ